MADGCYIENRFWSYSAVDCQISVKFCVGLEADFTARCYAWTMLSKNV